MKFRKTEMLERIARRSPWLAFLLLPFLGYAQTVTVNGGTVYQTIDGFGASTGYIEQNPNMTSAQAASYFSTSGIGLAWVRIQDCGSQTGDCSQPGTTYTPDLSTLQNAVNNGAKVLISFDPVDGSPSQWASETAYILKKVAYLQANGVPVSEISPINEPSNGNNFTGAYIDGFIKVLGPALASAGYNIPIAIPEWESQFTVDFSSICMADSQCAPYVNVAAEHGYATWPFAPAHYSAVPSYFGSRKVWQTEVNDSLSKTYTCAGSDPPWDPSIADGVAWGENIHDFLTIQNGSLWMYWNLGSHSANPSCNDGLADYSFNSAKRFYVVGNWSKFVRPGWVRVSATSSPTAGVYVTAFTDQSTGAFAIVAVNSNSNSVAPSFNLVGVSASSVTPYITDANNNLAGQTPISSSGGNFTATLNATSVTTFVSAGSAPGVPTKLVGAVVK